MKKTDKREEILRVAMELIAEKGFHGSPMSEIAGKAGVAAGTIYRYFQSKEELIDVLSRELQTHMLAVLMDGYPTTGSIRERFLYLLTGLIRYFTLHPHHFRFMEQYHNSPYGVSLRRARIFGKSTDMDIFSQLIALGIARGEVKNLPPAILFGLAFGPLTMIMQDHILGFLHLDEGMIRQVVPACWDAIKMNLLHDRSQVDKFEMTEVSYAD